MITKENAGIFLSLITLAVLLIITTGFGGCGGGSAGGGGSTTPPPPPPPPPTIYELTDGNSYYDNFDGVGAKQSYNDQYKAESGKLSSALWVTSEPHYDSQTNDDSNQVLIGEQSNPNQDNSYVDNSTIFQNELKERRRHTTLVNSDGEEVMIGNLDPQFENAMKLMDSFNYEIHIDTLQILEPLLTDKGKAFLSYNIDDASRSIDNANLIRHIWAHKDTYVQGKFFNAEKGSLNLVDYFEGKTQELNAEEKEIAILVEGNVAGREAIIFAANALESDLFSTNNKSTKLVSKLDLEGRLLTVFKTSDVDATVGPLYKVDKDLFTEAVPQFDRNTIAEIAEDKLIAKTLGILSQREKTTLADSPIHSIIDSGTSRGNMVKFSVSLDEKADYCRQDLDLVTPEGLSFNDLKYHRSDISLGEPWELVAYTYHLIRYSVLVTDVDNKSHLFGYDIYYSRNFNYSSFVRGIYIIYDSDDELEDYEILPLKAIGKEKFDTWERVEMQFQPSGTEELKIKYTVNGSVQKKLTVPPRFAKALIAANSSNIYRYYSFKMLTHYNFIDVEGSAYVDNVKDVYRNRVQ